MRTHPRSHARIVLPLFAVSALVSISFIAAMVLFVAAHPTLGMISLILSGVGFLGLFVALRVAISREAASAELV